ncbi:hypothetical protein HAX54_004383, partial [Datura stramonium]|nr:hypothetical protein [Datura stramonium]
MTPKRCSFSVFLLTPLEKQLQTQLPRSPLRKRKSVRHPRLSGKSERSLPRRSHIEGLGGGRGGKFTVEIRDSTRNDVR